MFSRFLLVFFCVFYKKFGISMAMHFYKKFHRVTSFVEKLEWIKSKIITMEMGEMLFGVNGIALTRIKMVKVLPKP